LLDAKVLAENSAELVKKLKNCFSFTLHNSKKWLVITMYYNATKKYSFLAVNLESHNAEEFESIKLAKGYVNTELAKPVVTPSTDENNSETPNDGSENQPTEQPQDENKPQDAAKPAGNKSKGGKAKNK
jgi:hypothetical protein